MFAGHLFGSTGNSSLCLVWLSLLTEWRWEALTAYLQTGFTDSSLFCGKRTGWKLPGQICVLSKYWNTSAFKEDFKIWGRGAVCSICENPGTSQNCQGRLQKCPSLWEEQGDLGTDGQSIGSKPQQEEPSPGCPHCCRWGGGPTFLLHRRIWALSLRWATPYTSASREELVSDEESKECKIIMYNNATFSIATTWQVQSIIVSGK